MYKDLDGRSKLLGWSVINVYYSVNECIEKRSKLLGWSILKCNR